MLEDDATSWWPAGGTIPRAPLMRGLKVGAALATGAAPHAAAHTTSATGTSLLRPTAGTLSLSACRGLRRFAGSGRDLREGRRDQLRLLRAQHAQVALQLRVIHGPHLLEHRLARGRELGLKRPAVPGAVHAFDVAGLLEAVDELGDASAAQREPVGQLTHSRAPVGTGLDRLKQLKPAERREIGGSQRLLYAIGHRGVAGDHCPPCLNSRCAHTQMVA